MLNFDGDGHGTVRGNGPLREPPLLPVHKCMSLYI